MRPVWSVVMFAVLSKASCYNDEAILIQIGARGKTSEPEAESCPLGGGNTFTESTFKDLEGIIKLEGTSKDAFVQAWRDLAKFQGDYKESVQECFIRMYIKMTNNVENEFIEKWRTRAVDTLTRSDSQLISTGIMHFAAAATEYLKKTDTCSLGGDNAFTKSTFKALENAIRDSGDSKDPFVQAWTDLAKLQGEGNYEESVQECFLRMYIEMTEGADETSFQAKWRKRAVETLDRSKDSTGLLSAGIMYFAVVATEYLAKSDTCSLGGGTTFTDTAFKDLEVAIRDSTDSKDSFVQAWRDLARLQGNYEESVQECFMRMYIEMTKDADENSFQGKWHAKWRNRAVETLTISDDSGLLSTGIMYFEKAATEYLESL